jgi:type VI secretion system protein ImpL
MDAELVRQWMTIDWAATWPGPANEAVRAELDGHLVALLDGRMPEIALDGNLVASARETLARFPLHERAYALIQQSQEARSLPEWRIVDYAGPAAPRVFVRPSGRSLSEGVPGLYTYVGFHGVFLPASAEVAREVAGEAWVLGTGAGGLDDTQVAALQEDVTELYFIDYIARWDGILADIAIIPFQSLSHAVETLNIISGPTSPLKALLVAIADETLLTAPPDPTAAAEGEGGIAVPPAVAAGLQARAGRAGRLAGLLGQAAGGTEQSAEALPGQPVVDHFRPLHELVIAPEGAPAPIDAVITTLNQLYGDLQRMSTAINQGGRALEELQQGGAGASVQQLLADAPRMPDPVSGIMAGVAQASTALTVGGAKSQVDGLWQSGVKQLCQRALGGRYPMNRGSQTDVNLDDFTQLFSPGGRIDQFFNTNLAPFVDMSTRPWKWARVGNTELGISDAALMQFQRAADIRDAFFATGAAGASFELVPVELDASATQVLIDLDGQQLLYNHGPPRPVSMKWPGPGGTGQVRISFSPPLGSAPSTITKNGPWSIFRLFDEGRIRAVQSDRFTVTFNVGGRSATFELRAGSVNNPFSMPALRDFRCPDSL